MKKKSNKQFMIFSAIMMVLVVDAHAWSSMSLLTRYMTYNMYIMPAFVFVSGYFFSIKQEQSFVEYAKKKTKSLIVPYYIWWGVCHNLTAFKVYILSNYCRSDAGHIDLRTLERWRAAGLYIPRMVCVLPISDPVDLLFLQQDYKEILERLDRFGCLNRNHHLYHLLCHQ